MSTAPGDTLAAERAPVKVAPRPDGVAEANFALRDSMDMPAVINLPLAARTSGAWEMPW